MGIYDRDYSQSNPYESHGSGVGFGGRGSLLEGRPITITLIVINVAAFFANLFFGGPGHLITGLLSARPETLLQPWMWWQFLTYGFAHDPMGINHILFNMLVLFFFGLAVERQLGRYEFLRFYLIAIVLGGVLWSLRILLTTAMQDAPPLPGAVGEAEAVPRRYTLMGASGGVQAVLILFALRNPQATILLFFVIPMKAWLLAVLVAGFDLLGALGALTSPDPERARTAFDVHLVGIAWAVTYHLGKLRTDRLLGSGGRAGSWARGGMQMFRSRPRLRLHDPEAKLAREAAEADRILQKIHDSGEESLTAAERRTLENYSRRMRGRRP